MPREVHHRARSLGLQTLVSRVADDTDDRHQRPLHDVADANLAPDRIDIRPIPSRHRRVDDHHFRRAVAIVGGNVTPAQQSMTVVARTRGDAIPEGLRVVLTTLDRRLPAPTIAPMTQLVGSAMATRRFALTLFGVFAATAVVLAAIGLYGVLAFLVRQRTHELGIRVALGATRSRLLMLVVGGALRLTIAGVVVGLLGAYALTRLLGSLLFGVSATDTTTFVALPLLLAAVALLASVIPGARATRADPMSALRGE